MVVLKLAAHTFILGGISAIASHPQFLQTGFEILASGTGHLLLPFLRIVLRLLFVGWPGNGLPDVIGSDLAVALEARKDLAGHRKMTPYAGKLLLVGLWWCR
jgi:hypothetical protein